MYSLCLKISATATPADDGDFEWYWRDAYVECTCPNTSTFMPVAMLQHKEYTIADQFRWCRYLCSRVEYKFTRACSCYWISTYCIENKNGGDEAPVSVSYAAVGRGIVHECSELSSPELDKYTNRRGNVSWYVSRRIPENMEYWWTGGIII